jgi:hypothetical protein
VDLEERATVSHTPGSKTLMPYRRSIWEGDDRYGTPSKRGAIDWKLISTLQSIEAAKKRTPPIPLAELPKLANALKAPPQLDGLNAATFAAYLKSLLVYGCGIKTAVGMLAVISKGEFPPMDEKLAAGIRNRDWIDAAEAKALNGASVQRFAKVYVERVMPRWRKARARGRKPSAIDRRWARWSEKLSV